MYTLQALFKRARAAAPSVVFFDEIDALAGKRGDHDGGGTERVLSQLLIELDGVQPLNRVIVVAATNRCVLHLFAAVFVYYAWSNQESGLNPCKSAPAQAFYASLRTCTQYSYTCLPCAPQARCDRPCAAAARQTGPACLCAPSRCRLTGCYSEYRAEKHAP